MIGKNNDTFITLSILLYILINNEIGPCFWILIDMFEYFLFLKLKKLVLLVSLI